MNFANDPSLDEGDILACWNFDGNFVVVEPGVGVATSSRHNRAGCRIADGLPGVAIYLLNAMK